jgi:hypothetical protein
VTVILPHAGNPFQQKVPAAIHVINGFGKYMGIAQVDELGVIEGPIAAGARVIDALFEATAAATEEAILNALFRATTVASAATATRARPCRWRPCSISSALPAALAEWLVPVRRRRVVTMLFGQPGVVAPAATLMRFAEILRAPAPPGIETPGYANEALPGLRPFAAGGRI